MTLFLRTYLFSIHGRGLKGHCFVTDKIDHKFTVDIKIITRIDITPVVNSQHGHIIISFK